MIQPFQGCDARFKSGRSHYTLNNAGWSNGSFPESLSGCPGSSPGPATKTDNGLIVLNLVLNKVIFIQFSSSVSKTCFNIFLLFVLCGRGYIPTARTKNIN